MDALQAAQSVYDSTIKNLAGKTLELDAAMALQVATFCAQLAQAEAAQRQAVALEQMAKTSAENLELLNHLHGIKAREVKIAQQEMLLSQLMREWTERQ